MLAPGDPDVGVHPLARAVDDTAHHRHGDGPPDAPHRLLDPLDHREHVDLEASAGGAGDEVWSLGLVLEVGQDLAGHPDLLLRLADQRDPDGVADPLGEEDADAERALNAAGVDRARLGEPEMERVAVVQGGELAVGRQVGGDVRRLQGHLDLVKVQLLEDADVAQGGLHHQLRGLVDAAPAAALQPLAAGDAAGVDPDPHRDAPVPRLAGDVGHLGRVGDVAGVEPEARDPRLQRLQGARSVVVDVGDNRYRRAANDLTQRPARLRGVAGDPHDVGTGGRCPLDLGKRPAHVLGLGLGHGLDRDRGGPADHDPADVDGDGPAAVGRGHLSGRLRRGG